MTVIKFPGSAQAPDLVDTLLIQASEAKLVTAVVVGVDDNGDFYFFGNRSGAATINLCLDFAKRHILDMVTADIE